MSQAGSSPYQSFTHSPYGTRPTNTAAAQYSNNNNNNSSSGAVSNSSLTQHTPLPPSEHQSTTAYPSHHPSPHHHQLLPHPVSPTPPHPLHLLHNNNNNNSANTSSNYPTSGGGPDGSPLWGLDTPTSNSFRSAQRPPRLNSGRMDSGVYEGEQLSTPTLGANNHAPLPPHSGGTPPQLLSPKSMVVGYNPQAGGGLAPPAATQGTNNNVFMNNSFFKPGLTSPHQRGLPSPHRGGHGGARSSPHGSFSSFPPAARNSPPTVLRPTNGPITTGQDGLFQHHPPQVGSPERGGAAAAAAGGGSSEFEASSPIVLRQRRKASASSASISDATTATTTTDMLDTESMVSGSSSSSLPNDLPLCPNDAACVLINDKKHQRQFSHSCRLFPCYHAHVKRHAKLFRHAPGQVPQTEFASALAPTTMAPAPTGKTAKQSQRATLALASVNFSHISPDAPNAVKISVSCKDKAYDIFGDWKLVKIHTLKRYLHQVFAVPPRSQKLYLLLDGGEGNNKKLLDDDLASAGACGVVEHAQIVIETSDADADPSISHNGIGFGDL